MESMGRANRTPKHRRENFFPKRSGETIGISCISLNHLLVQDRGSEQAATAGSEKAVTHISESAQVVNGSFPKTE